jgi:hypothetical protein
MHVRAAIAETLNATTASSFQPEILIGITTVESPRGCVLYTYEKLLDICSLYTYLEPKLHTYTVETLTFGLYIYIPQSLNYKHNTKTYTRYTYTRSHTQVT